jgi:molecular chaperone GrpE (heat shock protein)
MANWFNRLVGKQAQTQPLLVLEGKIQTLQLDLAERERTVAALKQELERRRLGASAEVNSAVQAQVEHMLADLAAPVAQLLTQAHLLEVEGKSVQARDVVVVSKRMVRVLQDNGLTLAGQVGETTSFDPNAHESLNTEATLSPGQRVVIRFVGVLYQGKVLRKAGVTPA